MSATAVDGHGELVEQLDLLVREAVRRQGVDPQRDAPVVLRIAEGVVRDHDERSLTGAVTPTRATRSRQSRRWTQRSSTTSPRASPSPSASPTG